MGNIVAVNLETGEATQIKTMKQLLDSIEADLEASGKHDMRKLPCQTCNDPSGGGRYSCCAVPTCYKCYDGTDVVKSEEDLFTKCTMCGGDRGYVRVKEIEEEKKAE